MRSIREGPVALVLAVALLPAVALVPAGCHRRVALSVGASRPCNPPCSPGFTCTRPGVCAATCVPDCAAGWTCVAGRCIAECNPPCAGGYECSFDRVCRPPGTLPPVQEIVAITPPRPVPVAPEPTLAPEPAAPPEPPPARTGPHDARIRLAWELGIVHSAGPAFQIAGATSAMSFAWSPATFRTGLFALDAWIGAAFELGLWDPGLLFGLQGELGASIRLGDRNGFELGGAWTPGLLVTAGAASGVLGGTRIWGALVLGSATVGLQWRALQAPGQYSLHAFEVFVGVGFL